MADINIHQDESEDPQDDGGDDPGLGCDDYDTCNPDDNLTPIQKLEKYMDSENIFSRQMVARSLLETIRVVGENEDEATMVLKAMVKLSDDTEPTVRAELMEQVPHLAMYCHENAHLFTAPIPTYLLPTVVRYLTDSHNQVRKTSQAALLVLLEQELVDKADVEEQVCPIILDLSSPDSIDDFRTEAVALMSKMAPLVGKDITQRVFMMRFAELCTDALFHVRKVCAANFGDMCTVVGQDNTEEFLLPKFYCLCEDGVWGVRKACAECFIAVACACSLDVRRNELTSLFIALMCDQSRWVRMASFQALGGFISTFADPDVTGVYLNEDGVLVAGNPDDHIKGEDGPIKFIDDDPETVESEETTSSSCSGYSSADSEPSSPSAGPTSTAVPSNCDPIAHNQQLPPPPEHVNAHFSGSQSPADDAGVSPVAMEIDPVQVDSELSFNNDGANSTDSVSVEKSAADSSSAENQSLEELRAAKYAEQYAGQTETDTDVTNGTVSQQAPVSEPAAVAETTAEEESRKVAAEPVEHTEDKVNPTQTGEEASSDSSTVLMTSLGSQPAGQDSIGNTVLDRSSCSLDSPRELAEAVNTRTKTEGTTADEPIEEDFNDFTFWRTPLPDVDVDLDLVKVKTEVQHDQDSGIEADPLGSQLEGMHLTEDGGEESLQEGTTIHTASLNTVSETPETVTNIGSTHVLGQHINVTTMTVVNGVVQGRDVTTASGLSYSPRESSSLNTSRDSSSSDTVIASQDVVPQALLDHYLSMTDPSRANNTDTEIARHCAFTLPAVAYTLGRKHWPCLKELYETLAGDMQWKVRRTLAFSIHELAVIVGEEITNEDLVPVFNGFLRDLDEVRIGVLKHLGDFLKLLRPEVRRDYLTRIPDFLNTDNTRNWRFREELAGQLQQLLDLYDEEDISKHIMPIALSLTEDKVSEVRQTSYKLMSGVLRRLASGGERQLVDAFVKGTINNFANSKQWNRRQIYAQLCHHILQDNAINPEDFADQLLPSLIGLGHDPIPNVRIALSKSLSQHIIPSEYFCSDCNPRYNELQSTIDRLKADTDPDVRYFINRLPQTEIDIPTMNDEGMSGGMLGFERNVQYYFYWS